MTPAFVDHYETLQLSPTAGLEVVERVYRVLAKRYHPDNLDSGDVRRFSDVQMAYETLCDPRRRAQYDVQYDAHRSQQWKIFNQESAGDHREEDRRLFRGILSVLYVARRRDPISGTLGVITLETVLGCPQQHLEFPIWYLKKRAYIEVADNGQLGITVDGVDRLTKEELSLPLDRLLTAPSLPMRESFVA
ncbi:MAG TPA: J domain-containing protein [Vicinamibacterales bacterium]|nr:J domain-containing protein [Vicinamibacterales bacterium]